MFGNGRYRESQIPTSRFGQTSRKASYRVDHFLAIIAQSVESYLHNDPLVKFGFLLFWFK
jgi:hypothetical protein